MRAGNSPGNAQFIVGERVAVQGITASAESVVTW